MANTPSQTMGAQDAGPTQGQPQAQTMGTAPKAKADFDTKSTPLTESDLKDFGRQRVAKEHKIKQSKAEYQDRSSRTRAKGIHKPHQEEESRYIQRSLRR